jgi:hypothetical protein
MNSQISPVDPRPWPLSNALLSALISRGDHLLHVSISLQQRLGLDSSHREKELQKPVPPTLRHSWCREVSHEFLGGGLKTDLRLWRRPIRSLSYVEAFDHVHRSGLSPPHSLGCASAMHLYLGDNPRTLYLTTSQHDEKLGRPQRVLVFRVAPSNPSQAVVEFLQKDQVDLSSAVLMTSRVIKGCLGLINVGGGELGILTSDSFGTD